MAVKTIEAVAVADAKGNVSLVPAKEQSFWDKQFLGIGSLRNGDVAELAVICTGAAVVGWGIGTLLNKMSGNGISDAVAGLTGAMDGFSGGRL